MSTGIGKAATHLSAADLTANDRHHTAIRIDDRSGYRISIACPDYITNVSCHDVRLHSGNGDPHDARESPSCLAIFQVHRHYVGALRMSPSLERSLSDFSSSQNACVEHRSKDWHPQI